MIEAQMMIDKNTTFLFLALIFFALAGCVNGLKSSLNIKGGEALTYQCENHDRIIVRYYSLSDGSLNFVKVIMPEGKEYTLSQVLSASGARYTNEMELIWWIKGDSASLETREMQGGWVHKYRNCKLLPGKK